MDYDDVAAQFLIPTGSEPTPPDVTATPARRLRDSVEAIATIGWWSREASDASRSLGHGFFDAYVWGRAAALGADVEPAVVAAAFGVFSPDLLGPVYQYARSISTREQILEARAAGAVAGLRAATTDLSETIIVEAADRLLGAVLTVDAGSRALFAALRSLPVPNDPYGRLWRAAELVREHRGDSHLGAIASSGLGTSEVNVLTEIWLGYPIGEYSATRGLASDAATAATVRLAELGLIENGLLTDSGRSRRVAIEAATDAGQRELIDAFGDQLDPAIELTEQITASVLRAHAAPADPRKRAAG